MELPLLVAVIVLAQDVPGGTGLPTTTLGLAGVVILFLQGWVWTLWKDGRSKDAGQVAMIDRTLPVLSESAVAARENAEAIRALADAVKALTERVPTREEMAQLRRLLQRRA